MLTIHLITIFPEIFDSYLSESILKRAQKNEKVDFKIYNLRDYTKDKHKTVDDTPYGGGPGMVMKIEPIYECVKSIKSKIENRTSKVKGQRSKVVTILTSAKGREYSQKDAERYKTVDDLIIICGRYEGVDERVAEHLADEEISIGKYVLTGGELPALVIADSVTRLLPGVLGNEESLVSESHQLVESRKSKFESWKDFPVYTKPEEFKGWKVPEVLLSGNHEEIEAWREERRKG